MVSLNVLLIIGVLVHTGTLSAPQSTTPEHVVETGEGLSSKDGVKVKFKNKETALRSAEEEEIVSNVEDKSALEDYVGNELPNFSGDVSSAIQKNLGDNPAGYDVHIEVKISNRSKTKFDKNKGKKNVELNDVVNDPNASHKNRMKAKKILDLIIDKLKRKKDAKEKIDDTTDVEIEDVMDAIGVTPKRKNTKESSWKTEGPSNEERGEETKDVDSIEKNDQVALKDKNTKMKEEHGKSPIKATKQKSVTKTKDKTREVQSHTKIKDDSKNKLAFNLPQKASQDESFPQDMPSANTDGNAPIKTPKSGANTGKGETRYIKIKVSGDEIRIKVPEFMNKTVLFSKIINLIEEDGKKGQVSKLFKAKSGSLNEAKQSLLQVGSRLLLLKKIHNNNETSKSVDPAEVSDHHLPEVVAPDSSDVAHSNDAPIVMLSARHKENVNMNDEVKGMKANYANQSNTYELDEGSVRKKDEDKDRSRAGKSFKNESDSNDDRFKNENNFIPNNFASKSFQENLEPGEISPKQNQVHEKKTYDVEPELHIEDVDEGKNDMTPKHTVTKAAMSRNHKAEHPSNKNIMSIFKHAVGQSLNPSRLFNDSLFREAGLGSSDSTEGSPNSVKSSGEESHRHLKLNTEKKSEKTHHPIIDVLTFHEFNGDTDHSNHKPTTNGEERNEKMNTGETDKEEKARRSHEHRKTHTGGELRHNNDDKAFEEEHEKADTTAADKDDTPENIGTTEQLKPLSNPLPNILFKEILNTDESDTKSTKKSDNDALEDKEDGEKEKSGEETQNISDIKNKIASLLSKRQGGGSKLDFTKLASLQLKSKDNLEIGNDDDDDGDSGSDDDYEEASGADSTDDTKETSDINGLGEANLAIWKASEDIHALLHSLQDKDHADKVLGNLRTFIRNKNIEDSHKNVEDAHKRDLNDNEKRKTKNLHSKVKPHIEEKLPSLEFEFRKKSEVPRHPHEKKLKKTSKIPDKKRASEKRQRIPFDKFTNHTGQGIDRLYNQLATANARIPPTFDDDGDGWSSDDVTNVMTQLKSTEIEDDLLPPNAGGLNAADFPGVSMYTTKRLHHIGLPQTAEHAAAITAPMKELIGYQKELRTQMIQSNTKDHIFSKSPRIRNMFSKSPRIVQNMFPKSPIIQNMSPRVPRILEFRKTKVSEARLGEPEPGLPSEDEFDGERVSPNKVNVVPEVGQQRSRLPVPNNSSMQLGTGDYFEGTSAYNLNKNELWWSNNFKRNLVHQNSTT